MRHQERKPIPIDASLHDEAQKVAQAAGITLKTLAERGLRAAIDDERRFLRLRHQNRLLLRAVPPEYF